MSRVERINYKKDHFALYVDKNGSVFDVRVRARVRFPCERKRILKGWEYEKDRLDRLDGFYRNAGLFGGASA